MTREEAIRWLNDRKAKYLELTRRYPCSSQLMLTTQVIDMAIEALSAEAISREDTVTLNSPISIQAEMLAVVRCKDCKYLNRKEAYGDEWKECTHYPQHHIRLNDYCSYGERREL